MAIQFARTPKKAKTSAAARPSAAEKGCCGLSQTSTAQLARAPKKAKPSAAARPSVAEKGGLEVSPDCHSTTRLCAKEAKSSDHAERSGEIASLDYNSNQRVAKIKQTQRDLPSARQKDVSFALIFPRIKALLCVWVLEKSSISWHHNRRIDYSPLRFERHKASYALLPRSPSQKVSP
jgi:hypothetical protein